MCVHALIFSLSLSCAGFLAPPSPPPGALARAAALAPPAAAPFGELGRGAKVADAAQSELSPLSLALAPDWRDRAVVDDAFRTLRDAHVRHDPAHPWLPRRVSWLYPVDDCYVRAASATEVLRELRPGLAPPAKVFLFGHLRLRTEYAPGGVAYWSYHVALLARVGEVPYVLDPAVDASEPLTVSAWIARQTEDPASTRIAACGGATYGPVDGCDPEVAFAPDPRLARDEARNLRAEWQRQLDLGRRPERELGSRPPWFDPEATH